VLGGRKAGVILDAVRLLILILVPVMYVKFFELQKKISLEKFTSELELSKDNSSSKW
jgi:hypothetical protein